MEERKVLPSRIFSLVISFSIIGFIYWGVFREDSYQIEMATNEPTLENFLNSFNLRHSKFTPNSYPIAIEGRDIKGNIVKVLLTNSKNLTISVRTDGKDTTTLELNGAKANVDGYTIVEKATLLVPINIKNEIRQFRDKVSFINVPIEKAEVIRLYDKN